MRLWHKDLIPFLPRQQLLGQWRECCLIAKQIVEQGTPNHILVNKIMDYPMNHFNYYAFLVYYEIHSRGYKINPEKFQKWLNKDYDENISNYPLYKDLFKGWHDDIYLRECLYNLEEKARASGITEEEWKRIYNLYCRFTPLWNNDC